MSEKQKRKTSKKRRYLCNKCKCQCQCQCAVEQRGYPEHIRRKAIQLYLEGNGFRRIERILKVSHVSVINWVKKAGAKLEKLPKKEEKVDVLELDELCINLKKHLALDRSRSRYKAACWLSNRHSRNKTHSKS